MGCDIHVYQEKRVEGRWTTADAWEPSEYEDEAGRLVIPWGKRLYSGRNYRLFGVLANVRNGRGFAGVVTGTAVRPIAEPRGVPRDACVEYLREVESWGVDGHSHSWLSLADLDSYDWSMPRQNRGVMTLAEYRAWKRRGDRAEPEFWSGGVFGPKIRVIGEQEAQELHPEADPEGLHVEAWWTSTIRDDCAPFLSVVRPRLQELESERGAGNARIVFFFDN